MSVEIKVPSVGESITEAEIGSWLKKPGDSVRKDEPVVVIETEKATVEIPSPESGTLAHILKKKGDVVAIGEVIADVEPGAPAEEKKIPPKTTFISRETSPVRQVPSEKRWKPIILGKESKQEGPAKAPPSSMQKKLEPVQKSPTPPQPAPPVEPLDAREERIPMSPLRRHLAERLVHANQTAALLTTFNEVDMTAIQQLRQGFQEVFQKKHEVKLGLMSFFVKATIEALKMFPQLNAEVEGTDLVYHRYFDIGIAVSTEKGLVVPVLRDAERMSLAEIEKTISDFATRARENKLKLEELQGGTFTITNGGVFGSLMSTPIVNPPQSGILGIHSIQDRPIALQGQVVIRSMMYVALTYDHRIVDGREAVLFLKRIKEIIEEPARLLIEA
jgi:2-oxoglutarate dehydrogenase E2 component (dihydrolipoamide succinyltransferase)